MKKTDYLCRSAAVARRRNRGILCQPPDERPRGTDSKKCRGAGKW